MDKLSEKLNSRLLVQKEHGFQKGAQCAPWPQDLKKSLAWIGLRGQKDDTAAEVAGAKISGILGLAKRPKGNTTKDEEGALTQLRKNEAKIEVM